MIDEQSPASGHDYASNRWAIGAGSTILGKVHDELEKKEFAKRDRTKIRTSAVFWAEYDVYSVIIVYHQHEYWFYSSLYHDV